MAKTSRPAPASVTPKMTSDDPLENLTLWLQANGRTLAIAGAVVVAAGLGIYGVRTSDAKKRANASTALYAAQAPLSEGRLDAGRSALEGVASRYKGTTAGEQAVLLLAQSYFDEGNFAEGISKLQAARSGASGAFAAPIESMLAAGYEGQADFAKAAEHYANAAKVAGSQFERDGFVLSQARALMVAGKRTEAITLFEGLQAKEDSPFAQEASVRLGELRARGQ
jgi:predicted negative regulator of RcsB-dependent stress response